MEDAMRGDQPARAPAGIESDLTDSKLVADAKLDRNAFGPLYDRYFDRVFRYCFYRLGDWAEAEDAAGDIFANALAALPKLRDGEREDGFRCWLFTIAHNVVANWRRSRRFEDDLAAA